MHAGLRGGGGHVPGDGLGPEEGAAGVDVEAAVVALDGHLEQVPAAGDRYAGIVHEAIDAAELARDLLDDGAVSVQAREVEWIGHESTPGRRHDASQSRHPPGVRKRHGGDVEPLFRQRQCGRRANAARRAGHDRGLRHRWMSGTDAARSATNPTGSPFVIGGVATT